MSDSLERTSELVDKQDLIRFLKEKGKDDPDAFRMLQDWLAMKEAVAEQAETLDARVDFELERAEVYFLSGYVDYVHEVFHDVLYMARQEGREDLCEKILAERMRMLGY